MKFKNLISIVLLTILIKNKVYLSEIYLEASKQMILPQQEVITKTDIQKTSSENLAELLNKYGVNISKRSPMQSDISLNSCTFEQLKITLNGIPINDPQTGHHNLNLPISLEDIEYIEITKSGNFAKHPHSFAGVVNIVTKKTSNNFLKFSYGSFNTFLTKAHLAREKNLLSLEFASSSGFKENTDYNYYNIFYKTNFYNSDFFVGILDKKFGAQDFYTTPSTRKEYEHIRTILAGVNSEFFIKENITNKLDIYLRSGYDFYTTQRYNPQAYSNYHNSYMYGFLNKLSIQYKNFIFEPLTEILFKQLDSKGFSSLFSWRGMGEFFDREYRLGLNFCYNYNNKFLLDASFIENYYSRYNFIPQFGAKISFNPFSTMSIFLAANKVHRVPSYTELFYWDPTHQGDESLKVEQSNNYQIGINKKLKNLISFSILGFLYEPTNMIDWVRPKGTTQSWRVANIAKVKSYGGSFDLKFRYKSFESKICYTYTTKEIDLDPTKELKYIENYPKHYLSLILHLPKIFGFETSIDNVYKQLTKTQPKEFIITNLGIKKSFKNLNFTFSIENLFDIKYEEIPGISQPPRTINFSTKINF